MPGKTEGQRQKAEELYERFGPALHAFAERQAPRDDADDVLQDALLVAVTKPVPSDREGPWLFRVIRNMGRRLRERKRIRRETHLPQEQHLEAKLPETLESQDERARVVAAVAALEPELRETIRLIYEDGLTHREAATRLGVPPTTVQSQLRLALRQLHKQLMIQGERP